MNFVSPLIWRSLALLTVAALLAYPVGHFFWPWLGWLLFCLALAFQLRNHLRHLVLLSKWSRHPGLDAELEGDGAWDEIFARIYRHEKDLRGQIEQLQAAITQFEAAGQALTDGVVLLDENNQIAWCNGVAEMQLGLALPTDRGQPITNLVRQPEFVDYLRRLEFNAPLTLRSDRKGGFVLSIYVLPYAEGKRLMQVKDITQTDRLDRMRRDFVANVSHELRTPLTVMAGFVETMQEIEVDREEGKRYLSMMAEQSGRMQNIVKDLLTLSSLESAPPADCEVIDMANLLNKLQRDAEALSAGRHQIVLESDGLGDLLGAESEIASALGNLVSNAIRYTPSGGKVTLHWQAAAKSGGVFSVQDTGIGIERQHIPRLTERFYRVDRGRSRDSGGTGLGLAIVKHSLQRHQASLEISSEPGKGSTFSAHFPARRITGL